MYKFIHSFWHLFLLAGGVQRVYATKLNRGATPAVIIQVSKNHLPALHTYSVLLKPG